MEEAAVRFELVDINEILKTLPHRYPMLLIDRVIKIRTDYSGIGIKNVTFNEPPFLGHFPDRPVYPGVMMIEAMAQTAGVIGIKSVEGTKIDNQVQIGHNVTIGRHCLLAAQIGLAGSLTIGDNDALGAKVGINNHLKIGDGAQVTAMSGVKDDIPPNGRWGGFFAKPTKQWFKEIVAVERLAQRGAADPKGEGRE